MIRKTFYLSFTFFFVCFISFLNSYSFANKKKDYGEILFKDLKKQVEKVIHHDAYDSDGINTIYELASRYYMGNKGVKEPDEDKAGKYYKILAKRHHIPSQEMLILIFENAEGSEKRKQFAQWLKTLEGTTNHKIQTRLILMYMYGLHGEPKDIAKALQLMSEYMSQDNFQAYIEMIYFYFVDEFGAGYNSATQLGIFGNNVLFFGNAQKISVDAFKAQQVEYESFGEEIMESIQIETLESVPRMDSFEASRAMLLDIQVRIDRLKKLELSKAKDPKKAENMLKKYTQILPTHMIATANNYNHGLFGHPIDKKKAIAIYTDMASLSMVYYTQLLTSKIPVERDIAEYYKSIYIKANEHLADMYLHDEKNVNRAAFIYEKLSNFNPEGQNKYNKSLTKIVKMMTKNNKSSGSGNGSSGDCGSSFS